MSEAPVSSEDPQYAAPAHVITDTVARDLSEQMAHYHQAIAARLGLSLADHKALDLVCSAGPLTAGQLAELTNLTTGGVTGLVDRLEQAGFVRRERDPHDRRRVIVQPCAEAPGLTTVFQSLTQALGAVCAHYTEEQLTTILAFLRELIGVLHGETSKLERQVPGDAAQRAGQDQAPNEPS